MLAAITRLVTLAQTGQPIDYAGSALMRQDLEFILSLIVKDHVKLKEDE